MAVKFCERWRELWSEIGVFRFPTLHNTMQGCLLVNLALMRVISYVGGEFGCVLQHQTPHLINNYLSTQRHHLQLVPPLCLRILGW